MTGNSATVKGAWSAIGACVVWGLFPVYWKQLVHVPGLHLIAHRFLWSFVLLAGIITLRGGSSAFRSAILGSRRSLVFPVTGFLIGVNWFTFLWAVGEGLIVEASLGYFITPLVNVGLGVVVLRETLRPAQWLSVSLALMGVVYLTVVYGTVPVIALTLAFSFGVYGLLKKTALVGATHSLAAETGAMFVPALVYVVLADAGGPGDVAAAPWMTTLLLVSTGPVTVVPLLLFGWAVQRIRLSLMGLIQYIAPTLQFVVGVAVYREPFAPDQLIGYALVWVALAVLTAEGILARRFPPSARTA